MKRIVVLAPLAVAALAWPAAAPAATRDCGFVSFIPNTDSGAFSIKAHGASCRVARSVARESKREGLNYRHRRFRCAGRRVTNGLEAIRYRCRRGPSLVTFEKT